MRNNREQQKKSTTPEQITGDRIARVNALRAELLSRLEEQRTLTTHLLERIVDYENLEKARKQVIANAGSSGIDKMEVGELQQWLWKNINTLRNELFEERYQVSEVRKVEIPKPQGGTRTLGIPTVKDRLIQQAIYQRLNVYYDPHFSEHSYGFRPGRSAHQAILRAAEYIRNGHEWVVDIDLEKFFDKINHDRLMQRLSKGIGDKRVLRLINSFLKAGMMADGLVEQRTAGTPQGGPLSPLLSNIVLDELDRELESREHKFCRYADDCNIFVKSQRAGERVLKTVIEFIEHHLKLKVNRSKSGVRHCSEVKFLGYTLLPEGKIRVADKSIERLKEKVKEITKRNRGVSFQQMLQELNRTLMGWSNYFRLANSWINRLEKVDGWIRRKVRCYKLKQCGRRYTIFKLLHSLGTPRAQGWYAINNSQGWWKMSFQPAINQAMSIHWLAQQGLLSLTSRMSNGMLVGNRPVR